MRLNGPSKASAAPAHRLLGMTCLSSIDGTVPILAATGAFANPATSAALGLTVVAGIGAWVAAWQSFPSRLGGRDWFRIAMYAAITMAITVAAAAAGALVAGHLHYLPYVAGAMVLAIALAIAGVRHASKAVPVLLVGGIILEVSRWIP